MGIAIIGPSVHRSCSAFISDFTSIVDLLTYNSIVSYISYELLVPRVFMFLRSEERVKDLIAQRSNEVKRLKSNEGKRLNEFGKIISNSTKKH